MATKNRKSLKGQQIPGAAGSDTQTLSPYEINRLAGSTQDRVNQIDLDNRAANAYCFRMLDEEDTEDELQTATRRRPQKS